MGLGNWLLKNGPGSPGSTAKHLTGLYLEHLSVSPFPPDMILVIMYGQRGGTNKVIGNGRSEFEKFSPYAIAQYCEGDLALYTFIILYLESQQFRNGLKMGMEGFSDTLQVIRDVVQKRDTRLTTLNLETYRVKALTFMNKIFENPNTIISFIRPADSNLDKEEIKVKESPEWLNLPPEAYINDLDGLSINEAIEAGLVTHVGNDKGEGFLKYMPGNKRILFAIIEGYAFRIGKSLNEANEAGNILDLGSLIFRRNHFEWENGQKVRSYFTYNFESNNF